MNDNLTELDTQVDSQSQNSRENSQRYAIAGSIGREGIGLTEERLDKAIRAADGEGVVWAVGIDGSDHVPVGELQEAELPATQISQGWPSCSSSAMAARLLPFALHS